MSPANLLVRFSLLAIALAYGGCYQVPVTGRSAVNMVSDEAVIKVSQEAFDGYRKKYRVTNKTVLKERVQRVGERIAKVAFWDVPAADWEFVVFEAPDTINAFAMAGGKVGVFTGLFKIVENDDQLAAVMAHEIAHVAAKHVNERLSQALAIEGGNLVLGGIMSTVPTSAITANAILDAYGLSTDLAANGFDRKKEKEADYIGVMYMARAGFNPEEAPKVIENLEKINEGKATPPAILSTHPPYPERILQMIDMMPKALEAYRQSGRTQTPQLVK